MDKVLLLLTAASGLCVVSSHVGRQYHFVYELKNMTEAQSYCREQYTDLATVDNMEDVRILNNMADLSRMVYSENSHRAWIGLYDDLDSWRWSLSDTSFYQHGEMEFRVWSSTEPNNYKGEEHCVLMYSDGRWNDFRCDSHFRAVCMDLRGPNVTFVLTTNSMNWTEAQSYCREHHTDLVSVRNTAENQQVRNAGGTGAVWIGLSRDRWRWLDGSNSSFRYWAPGEPNNMDENEACVAANFKNSGKWEDWNCNLKRAFVCYSRPTTKQVIRLRLQESSSLNLNDPAVMEQILEKLKQRLKDQGMNGDVKLSWRKQPDGKVFHKEEEKKKKKKSACKQRDEL